MSLTEELLETDFMVKQFTYDEKIPAGSKLLMVVNDPPDSLSPKWFVYEVPVYQ